MNEGKSRRFIYHPTTMEKAQTFKSVITQTVQQMRNWMEKIYLNILIKITQN